jgi:uncharacterized membrane protein (DUF485 family)
MNLFGNVLNSIRSIITNKCTFLFLLHFYPTHVSAVVQPSSGYTSRFTSLALVHLVLSHVITMILVFVASVHFQMQVVFVLR